MWILAPLAALGALLFYATRASAAGPVPLAPKGPVKATPPAPIPTDGGVVKIVSGDFQRSQQIVKGVLSGDFTAITKDPKAALATGARTALGFVTGGLSYVVPGLPRRATNPSEPQDQRERWALEYWLRYGATAEGRKLALDTVLRKKSRYGDGWGWTPDSGAWGFTQAQYLSDKLPAHGVTPDDGAIWAEVNRIAST